MQSRKTFIGQSAPIGALIACVVIGGPVRADVYAYVKPDASVMLTNIAVAAMQPAWIIRGPDALEVVAKPAMSTARDRYQDEVQAAAREYAVDSDLIHAVIVTESNYVRNAVSPKGAQGLMQLMPPTSKTYGVANAFDAMQNIRGGAQHLRHLLATFNGDIELALAAYNAGEMAVLKHGGAIPPFPETINYVRKVQSTYRDRKQIARVPVAD
jgi:soluble lytic murein transglycosylase-like protein